MSVGFIILIILGAVIGFFLLIFSIYLFIMLIKEAEKRDYDKRHLKTVQLNFFEESNNTFTKVKKNYLRLANELNETGEFKSWTQVQDTKNVRGLEKASGIYIIYLNTNQVNETIPLYIGQSKDIFARWKQHQNQFRKIVKGEVNIRTYQKIMHYLNIYEYSLQDLKFAVIEKCDQELLNTLEKKYILFFKTDIFGFNQTKGNK